MYMYVSPGFPNMHVVTEIQFGNTVLSSVHVSVFTAFNLLIYMHTCTCTLHPTMVYSLLYDSVLGVYVHIVQGVLRTRDTCNVTQAVTWNSSHSVTWQTAHEDKLQLISRPIPVTHFKAHAFYYIPRTKVLSNWYMYALTYMHMLMYLHACVHIFCVRVMCCAMQCY